MNVDELSEDAINTELTETDMANIQERLEKAEAEFAAEAHAKKITNEWLNREYTI